MTKLINGKTNENELNIIQTSAYSEPELVLPNNFTALHIAHICANLYSGTCPSDLMPDFTICENGDFAMYNVCLLYTSPSPRDGLLSRMPSSA